MVAVFGWWGPTNLALAAVSVCDEPTLRGAVAGGGQITFDCDGIIVLSSTRAECHVASRRVNATLALLNKRL
jgi:hypothetical protein